MDIIQIGSLTILLKWFLLGIAVLVSLVIVKIMLRRFSKSKQTKEIFDLLFNSLFYGFLVWKGSLFLFEPSLILKNPLSLLYFTGGSNGLILAIIFSLFYFIYQAKKLTDFLFTLKYGLIFIFAVLSIYHFLAATFTGNHFIYHLLIGFSALFIFTLIKFKKMRAKYKQVLATLGLIGMIAWGVSEFASSQKVKITETNNKNRFGNEELVIGVNEGNLAPDFQLQTLAGEELSLSVFKGKKVILNFWASWCPPCKAEMPHIQKFYLDRQNEQVEILAVNLTTQEKSANFIRKFAESYQLTFPILLDSDGRLGKIYQVFTIPSSYIIDSEGIIRKKIVGPVSQEMLEQLIKNVD